MQKIAKFRRHAVRRFGSRGFVHSKVAQGHLRVSLAELDGVIGGHEGANQQILVVLRGAVTVSVPTGSVDLADGEAVEWTPGEWHETRGRASLLLIEGDLQSLA